MKALNCHLCGDPIEHEYDHSACNTPDARECHETEYEHFAAGEENL